MSVGGFQAPVIFKAVDKLTRPIRTMTKGVERFATVTRNSVIRVERGFNRLGKTISGVAGSFGLFLGTAALVGTLSTGIKIFAEYESANSRLFAITNANEKSQAALAKQSQMLGATTSFTATQVANLQTELGKLGFNDKIIGMSESVLALGAATRTELPQAAKQLGSAMRIFGAESTSAKRVADVFAQGSMKSALNMEFLETSFVKAAPIAKRLNFTLEDTVAILGTLANAGFDASTAGTSFKNLLLKMADPGSKLTKALGKPVKNATDLFDGIKKLKAQGVSLAGLLEVTDLRAVGAFATLVDNGQKTLTLIRDLDNAMMIGDGAGAAAIMQAKQLDNLKGSYLKLTSAVRGWVIAMGQSNSESVSTVRNLMAIVALSFQLAAGMDDVVKATATESQIKWANALIMTAKAIGAVIAAVIISKGVILAVEGALILATGAVKAATVAMSLLTAASAALGAPIWLIILAVVAMVSWLTLVIKKWDEWGALLAVMLPPLGMIINTIMNLISNWEKLVSIIENGSFIDVIKSFGKVIVDALIIPIEQLLVLLNKVTGGNFGTGSALSFVKDIRKGLEIQDMTPSFRSLGADPRLFPEFNPAVNGALPSAVFNPLTPAANNGEPLELPAPVNPAAAQAQAAQANVSGGIVVTDNSEKSEVSLDDDSGNIGIKIKSGRID